ncbi:MAG: alpha/beta hydrolase [Thermaurantimonas sp.]|uniref:alpha/beta hydrolase n=1 Tax=Thermaurantimonas sp. TaxID=2681568 RepID=UPI003918C2C2
MRNVILKSQIAVERRSITSKSLGREVRIDFYVPEHKGSLGLLLMNDGQDADALHLKSELETFYHKHPDKTPLVVGIHAADRLHEYGTIYSADYLKRGKGAGAYHKFILSELLPSIYNTFDITSDRSKRAVMGFSMGALSAFDLVYQNPSVFGLAGCFSGSFWWRKKAYFRGFDEKKDRIIHRMVRKQGFKPGLRFWFMAGTQEEEDDRNNNGIIDVIDDQLDLIAQLCCTGYKPYYEIHYLEIENGQHNQKTWRLGIQNFLEWGFCKKRTEGYLLRK